MNKVKFSYNCGQGQVIRYNFYESIIFIYNLKALVKPAMEVSNPTGAQSFKFLHKCNFYSILIDCHCY